MAIVPARITQAGAQQDVGGAVPARITQAGAQQDVGGAVPARATQVGSQADVSQAVPARLTQIGIQIDARLFRPMTSVNCWEFHVEDRARTYLSYLDNAFDKSYLIQLNDVGGGSFSLYARDAKATTANLTIGNVVLVRYRNVDIGGFVIETIEERLVDQGETVAEILDVSGRGLLSLLERGIVYPADTANAANQDRLFSGVKAAGFVTLHDEYVARGGGELTPDFTATLDSSGDAWADSDALRFRAGQSLWDVAQRLTALDDIDFTVDPDHTLHAYAAAGTATAVILRHGYNLLSATKRTEGVQLINASLGEGEDVYVETTDSTSITAYGRREALLTVRNMAGSTQVTAANAQLIANHKDPVTSYSLTVPTHIDFPGITYKIGDTVKLEIPDKESGTYRILSIAITEHDDPCNLQATLEVNRATSDYLVRAKRAHEAALGAAHIGPGATDKLAASESSLIRYIIDNVTPHMLSDDGGVPLSDDDGVQIYEDL